MNDLISRKALIAEYDRVHIGPPGVARKLMEDAPAVQQWISVKDRLPQGADGKSICENVIAYLNNGEVEAQVCPGWLNGDKWYLLVGDEDYHTVWGLDAVTHWQPMPQPPKGE